MTHEQDRLEAALRGVPLIQEKVWPDGAVEDVPDYPALTTAALEWVRQNLPGEITAEWARDMDENRGFNRCLADVARRLGL